MTPFESTILGLLDPGQRERLRPHLEFCAYAEGRTILVRGELLDRVYLVVQGRAAARYKTKRGPCELELGPGDFFGETTITERATVSEAAVRAAQDCTTVVSLDDGRFRELLDAHPEIERWFLERAAARREALGGAILGLCEFTLPPRAWRPILAG